MKRPLKLRWIEAVSDDFTIKPGSRFVLTRLAWKYVANDGAQFQASLDTLAARVGVARRTVIKALGEGAARGYLDVEASAGGRSARGSRYTLKLRTETSAETALVEPETSAETAPKPVQKVHQLIAESALVSRSNDQLGNGFEGGDGSLDGSLDGGTRAGRATNPPSPPPRSRYCREHPNGTDKPCGSCAQARKNYEQRGDATALGAELPQPCGPRCDGRWKLNDDGTPVEPADLCPNDHRWTSA